MRFGGIRGGDDASRLESWLNDSHATGFHGTRRFARIRRDDIDAMRKAISER
jgi:hypothetical protein